MKRVMVIFSMLLGVMGLAGCNTMEGFGKDVSKLGDKIEQSAEKHK